MILINRYDLFFFFHEDINFCPEPLMEKEMTSESSQQTGAAITQH